MEISYEVRFFLYDIMLVISLIVVGYTLYMKNFLLSVLFIIVAGFMQTRLIRTMQIQYNPNYMDLK